MTANDLKAAIERADAACPCIRAMSGLNVDEFAASPCWRLRQKICRCKPDQDHPHIKCLWEGHALIRAAVRAGATLGFWYGWKWQNRTLSDELDSILGSAPERGEER